jgi:hypothetical protein
VAVVIVADILITSTRSLAGWGYIVLLAGMALGVLLMVGVWWVLHCPRSRDDLRAEWQAAHNHPADGRPRLGHPPAPPRRRCRHPAGARRVKQLPVVCGGLLAAGVMVQAAAWLVAPLLLPLAALTVATAAVYLLWRWRL